MTLLTKDWTGRKIHIDSNAKHDGKYSDWRRNRYPDLEGDRAYCTDIDFIEWRKGKAAAVLECKRGTIGEAITTILELRYGFQGQVIATVAHALRVPAYIVAIQDFNKEGKGYERASFTVVQMNLPTPWLEGSRELVPALLAGLGEPVTMDELAYARWIASL
ncbi:hypothetical protein UFOVP1573_6 [uncultured Caudovirales phage]|uniref:Uncharacterized protein n=1 Tax=uncultured Caudovirales phage TaxID=2100421 RepID=A0A6J5SL25_9CAUD|nr:hypothetical protein UFOVP1126_7 [uncultured Caudovirales phage]CAB4215305.1 hypothetical protein UFOVP1485_7 [uncultured Caudovirales phage]CAB5230411.1 hypothetical protein UFOVP1573_6 [uncultured Caudovirales phage]